MVNSDAVSALKSASLLFVMLLITTFSLVVLLKEITVRLEIGLPYSALIVLPFALQDGTGGSAAKANPLAAITIERSMAKNRFIISPLLCLYLLLIYDCRGTKAPCSIEKTYCA